MMLLHSTDSSSTFGAQPHHLQPLLQLNVMNSMPRRMVAHCPHTQNLMDSMLLQHYLRGLCSRFFAGFHILQGFDCGMSVQTVQTVST